MKYFAVLGVSLIAPYVCFLLFEDSVTLPFLLTGCIAAFVVGLVISSHLAFPSPKKEEGKKEKINRKEILSYIASCRINGAIPIVPKTIKILDEDHGAVDVRIIAETNGYKFSISEKHGDSVRKGNPPTLIGVLRGDTPIEVIQDLENNLFVLPSKFIDGQHARYTMWPKPNQEVGDKSFLLYKFIMAAAITFLSLDLQGQHIGPAGSQSDYLTFSTFQEENVEIHEDYACVGNVTVSISEAMEILADGALGRISRGARTISLGDSFPYEEEYLWALSVDAFTIHIETFFLKGIVFNVIFVNNTPRGLISDKGLKSLQGVWDLKYLRL